MEYSENQESTGNHVDRDPEPTPAQASTEAKLDQLLNEGAQNLAADAALPPKRGRGRPRKVPLHVVDPAAPAQPQAAQPTAVMNDDLVPFIKGYLHMPFDAIAVKAECPEIRLTDEEASSLAPQVDLVLKRYMPDVMNSPHAPAFMLSASIAALAYSKYRIYLDQKVFKEMKLAESAAAAA